MRGKFPAVRLFSWLLGAFLCASLAAPWGTAQTATIILHNGKILTVDKSFSTAEAVAVTGQKITAVGRNADILKLAGPNTQVIDLKGRTVVHGLVDTHRH